MTTSDASLVSATNSDLATLRWYLLIAFLVCVSMATLGTHLAADVAIEAARRIVVRDAGVDGISEKIVSELETHKALLVAFVAGASILGLGAAFFVIFHVGKRMIVAPLQIMRRSRRHLKESEARARRLALVAEKSTDLVIIYDMNGRILWVNRSFETTTGYTLSEVRGRSPAEFLNGPRTDRWVSRRIGEAFTNGEPISTQIVNYNRWGREYLVELNLTPVVETDGSIMNFVAVERDVSERQRAQRRLTEALEALDSAVCVFDADERLVAFNEAYRRLCEDYGVRVREGRSITELSMESAKGGMLGAVEDAETAARARIEALRAANGEPRTVSFRDGRVFKQIETRTASGDIVSMRTDVTDLATARARAEEATAAKSRFLATISHEVRTPMNGVISMAELLLESEMTADQRAGLELIAQSGHALITIINDILDFSKIEAGKLEIRPEPFDLIDALEDVCALLTPAAAEKRIDFALRFAPAGPRRLVGDMGRIRQIVTNLAGNAIKFTDRGGVVVSADQVATTEGVRVTIAVEDTGVGVSPRALEKIFAPFEQSESAGSARMQEGTGLGLSISRQLAALMGGEVSASSELGVGSRFVFEVTLPAHDAEDEDAADKSTALKGATVALLGPPAARGPISDQLRASGAAVVEPEAALADHGDTVADGPSRPGAPPGGAPDLVIAALGCDGAPPATLTAYAQLPCILIAGADQGRVDAAELGCGPQASILRKPVRSPVLTRAVQGALGADDAKAPKAERRAAPRELTDVAPRVVVAEDNATNAVIIEAILKDQQVEVVIYPDATKALAAIAKRAPAAVIMDLNLPDMSGVEAARLIREMEAREGRAQTPILAATASTAEEDRKACFEAGMNGYITKPFNANELREAVRDWAFRDKRAAASPQARAS